jgi:hypothetical protein
LGNFRKNVNPVVAIAIRKVFIGKFDKLRKSITLSYVTASPSTNIPGVEQRPDSVSLSHIQDSTTEATRQRNARKVRTEFLELKQQKAKAHGHAARCGIATTVFNALSTVALGAVAVSYVATFYVVGVGEILAIAIAITIVVFCIANILHHCEVGWRKTERDIASEMSDL